MAESSASRNDSGLPRARIDQIKKDILDALKADPVLKLYKGLFLMILETYTNPAFQIIRTLLAYRGAPSAIGSAVLELSEVADILLKLKSAGPHLPAALNENLESAVADCQETSFRLLNALKPYSGGERKKKSHRLQWAVMDSENVESILRTLLPQKRTLELLITTIATLSPTAFTNGQTPPVDGSTITTTPRNSSSLNIPTLGPDGLSEGDIDWINSLVDRLETTAPNEDQEAEVPSIGGAESVMDEASFFHHSYPSSIARSDNASHIYTDTSSRFSDDSVIKSETSRSSTDTSRQSSGSLFKFDFSGLRRNTGLAAGDFPASTASSRSNGSIASLRSIMSWRKPTATVTGAPSTETLNPPTEGHPPSRSDDRKCESN